VVHGYFLSCLVFFTVQIKGNKLMASEMKESHGTPSSSDVASSSQHQNLALFHSIKTFVVSLVSTALAEIASIPFYYPFDLIKVRM